MSAVESAYALVEEGRVADATAVLERAGAEGNGLALAELGGWYIQGQFVQRRLVTARECFRRAAECGSMAARMIYLSLVGNGTGGIRDWPHALRLLEAMAVDNIDAATQTDLIRAMALTEDGDPRTLPDRQIVSERPEIAWFPGLFTAAECSYLVQAAEPLLRPSVVLDPVSGVPIANPVRTSDAAGFPWASEVPVVHALNRRLAAASGTVEQAGEPLQILRYRPGQQYRSHHDAVQSEENQRIMTMLIYLNHDYSGGETTFTKACLKLRGAVGDALLFRNVDHAGRPDPMALHAGEPVTSGTKMIASRWIRRRAFGPDRLV